MGLTNGADLYAALNETGLQKFLHNVFLARPHYFHYATSSMGGGSTDVSLISPIPVPGSATGIEFSLQFTEPEIEFYPVPNSFFPGPDPAPPPAPAPTPLTVGQNQFALHTEVTISISTQAQALALLMKGLVKKAATPQNIAESFDVYAIGQPTTQSSGQGTFLSLSVTALQINGAGYLDAIVAFIGQQMLNGLLANLEVPVSSIGLGAFSLQLQPVSGHNDPEITENQLKVWAGIS